MANQSQKLRADDSGVANSPSYSTPCQMAIMDDDDGIVCHAVLATAKPVVVASWGGVYHVSDDSNMDGTPT